MDLGFLRFVTAIGTQGAISKETKKHYFVRSYRVDVSSTGEDWVTVKDNSKQKVTFAPQTGGQVGAPLHLGPPPPPQIFQGNHNPTDVAVAFLPKQTLARYVRIRPLTWEQGICMRFEIYGCRTSGSVSAGFSIASTSPGFASLSPRGSLKFNVS